MWSQINAQTWMGNHSVAITLDIDVWMKYRMGCICIKHRLRHNCFTIHDRVMKNQF